MIVNRLTSLKGSISLAVMMMLLNVPFETASARDTDIKKPDIISYIQGNSSKTRRVDIPRNKAAIIKLPVATRDVVVADPAMIDVVVRNPKEVYMFAKKTGMTNAFFFDSSGNQIVNLEINVGLDMKELERVFEEQMPGSNIKVTNMADTIILSGNVKNSAYAKIARDIAQRLVDSPEKIINNIGVTGQEQVMIKVKVAEIQREILKQLGIDWNTAFQIGKISGGLGLINGFGSNGTPATGLIGSSLGTGNVISKSVAGLPAFATSQAAASFLSGLQNDMSYLRSLIDKGNDQLYSLATDPPTGASPSTVDTLRREIANDITNWTTEYNQKSSQVLNINNQLTNATAVEEGAPALTQKTMGYRGENFSLDSLLRALERHSLIKTLAEPNLTALSGESAKFLAGGELPFLVSQTFGQASVDFKPYGIGLAFTPVVLNEGRISLKISTEVSEISGTVTAGNSSYPGLAVRRAETTVEMPSGGSLAMAGLIREDTRRSIDSTPGLKEVPVLGALFKSNDFKSNESELVILVTPYLVEPSSEKNFKLPTDGFVNPSDLDMYVKGKLAGVYGKTDDEKKEEAEKDNGSTTASAPSEEHILE